MDLRRELHRLCYDHITARIKEIQAAMAQVHDAMANETKSSAGDKYETAREMLQQEMDLNKANLNEMEKLKAILDHIAKAQITDTIMPGSVVHTDRANFYIAAGAGTFVYNTTKYHTISLSAPIGSKMVGLKAGDTFSFNNLKYTIREVL